MAKFFRGDKRRREMDRKRRSEEKARRLQVRRDLRAKGLDPDLYDAEGNPLPASEVAANQAAGALGADVEGDAGEEGEGEEAGEEEASDATPASAADRSKP